MISGRCSVAAWRRCETLCGEQLLDGEGPVVAGRDLHHAHTRFRHVHYMVQRLYQAGRAWSAGESLPAKLAWGPHTPDRAAVLVYVTEGYAYGPGIQRRRVWL